MNSKLEQLKKLKKRKKSKAYYAKQLGISELELNELYMQLDGYIPPPSTLTTTSESSFTEDVEKGKAELTQVVSGPIRTLQDLIEKCEIDLETWKIDKYIQNFWGNGNYQVKAFLSKKTIDNDLSKQKEFIFNELIKEKATIIFPVRVDKMPKWMKDQEKNADSLLEISIPDIHIGKLAWSPESGEDYDITIAVDRYRDALHELLSRVDLSTVEKIHLPLGNDAIHIDNAENQTTRGTVVDTDGRFPKIFKAAKDLFIETIEELRQIAPVDVTIVSGNHDYQTMFLLGEVLEAWFHGEEDVYINNSPRARKYYQYGDNGFQYTHGDKEKHADLGPLFAQEEPQLWADSKFRFCKLGHKHKSKKSQQRSFEDQITKDTFIGFQVAILPSLTGPDEWHYANGYIGIKQAKAFLYHKTKGEIGEFTTTV